MSVDLRSRLAALSPEKRALLERRLRASKPELTSDVIPHLEDLHRSPLSFSQQRLWFLEQLEPGLGHYNLPTVMRFNGSVDPDKLQQAINFVISRHAILRTRFVLVKGEPCQEITPDCEIRIQLLDLAELAPAERAIEANRLSYESAVQPFALGECPLIRAQLVRLGQQDFQLTVTMHHIVSDGWSLGLFSRELSSAYSALVMGEEPSLPPLSLQYADFATWQQQHLQGETLDRLLSYWKDKLAGMPLLLELPTDRPRPRVQTFVGGTLVRAYSRSATERLAKFAQDHEASLFMALLAVFKVLLHRFSGLTDIVVGSPIANRGRQEIEALIGFFVNTLVLRSDLSGDPNFGEVLDRVREVSLGAYAHQDLPFERLVVELNPDRNLDHNPLFQVMFGMQNTEAKIPAQNGESEFGIGTSKFDLTVSVTETEEGITCAWEFSSTLFESSTIAALADAFGVLMETVVQFPDRPISRLSLLTESQRQQVLTLATNPGLEPSAETVPRIFARQAAATPTAVAVDAPDRVLTYDELDHLSNQLARRLMASGVGPETIVGLCLDRSSMIPLAMLAVWKAGAAFLPLDPTLPPKRMAYMLADAGAQMILLHGTDPATLLSSYDGTILTLDTDLDLFDAYSDSPLDCHLPANALAYLIYTSGSTGRPKGVLVQHDCTANALQSLIAAFGLPAGTRVLQFGALSFDISIFDLLMAFGCGGTLCIAKREDLLPGLPLAESLESMRINAVTLPPSAMAVTPLTPLSELQTLVFGGEVLPTALADDWRAHGRRLINAYGPTETTIWTAFHDCEAEIDPPPIGKPVSRTQAYVLDINLDLVPPGFPGELYVGGSGVSRGYRDRPGLTAESFIPDPYSNQAGARLYRTGDRVVLRQDGAVRFLGRKDNQIKLRGYRIELSEIDNVMLGHDAIAAAAAIVQQTSGGEPRIVLFCVARDGASVAPADLHSHLRNLLPDYMVPARVVMLDSLPLNSSGKVDRQSLALQNANDAIEVGPDENETEIESLVAQVFAETLEVTRLGRTANFFEMGGHSLLATRAINRLNERFNIQLPLRALFEHPGVADMAAFITKVQAEGPGVIQSAMSRVQRRAVSKSEIGGAP